MLNKSISIIVPVKDNQSGIESLLDSFFIKTDENFYPLSIIIVDNKSKTPIYLPVKYKNANLPIHLIKCNLLGAGNARNEGVKFAIEQYNPGWILFTDSDCIFTKESIEGYMGEHSQEENIMAYQGSIEPLGIDWLSKTYLELGLFIIPEARVDDNISRPEYLVTANCLVKTKAFNDINGFDKKFTYASEDMDLSYRLNRIGRLAYAKKSVIKHDFLHGRNEPNGADLINFIERARRYGWGLGKIFNEYGKDYDEYFNCFNTKLDVNITKMELVEMRTMFSIGLNKGFQDFKEKKSPLVKN
ncbi:MAG: glycosyltransferase family 2 protein [Rickettsiaceae bacterium]